MLPSGMARARRDRIRGHLRDVLELFHPLDPPRRAHQPDGKGLHDPRALEII